MKRRMWKMLWKMGKTALWCILAAVILWIGVSVCEISAKDNSTSGHEYSSWNFFYWAAEYGEEISNHQPKIPSVTSLLFLINAANAKGEDAVRFFFIC